MDSGAYRRSQVDSDYSWNEYHERSAIEPFWDALPGVDPYHLYGLTAKFIYMAKKGSNP